MIAGFDPLLSDSFTLCSLQGHQFVMPCLWDIAHKKSLAPFQKERCSDPGQLVFPYHLIDTVTDSAKRLG